MKNLVLLFLIIILLSISVISENTSIRAIPNSPNPPNLENLSLQQPQLSISKEIINNPNNIKVGDNVLIVLYIKNTGSSKVTNITLRPNNNPKLSPVEKIDSTINEIGAQKEISVPYYFKAWIETKGTEELGSDEIEYLDAKGTRYLGKTENLNITITQPESVTLPFIGITLSSYNGAVIVSLMFVLNYFLIFLLFLGVKNKESIYKKWTAFSFFDKFLLTSYLVFVEFLIPIIYFVFLVLFIAPLIAIILYVTESALPNNSFMNLFFSALLIFSFIIGTFTFLMILRWFLEGYGLTYLLSEERLNDKFKYVLKKLWSSLLGKIWLLTFAAAIIGLIATLLLFILKL